MLVLRFVNNCANTAVDFFVCQGKILQEYIRIAKDFDVERRKKA
jgi:hypothetical protein